MSVIGNSYLSSNAAILSQQQVYQQAQKELGSAQVPSNSQQAFALHGAAGRPSSRTS